MNSPALQTFALALPLSMTLLGGAFLLFWYHQRSQTHLLWATVAAAGFTIGMLLQVLSFPADAVRESLLVPVVYGVACWALTQSVAVRLNVRVHHLLAGILVGAVLLGVRYHSVVVDSTMARIYVLNFGLGLILLLPSWRFYRGCPHHTVDRLLRLVFYLFALSFFVRTIFTAPWHSPLQVENLMRTTFWMVLNYSMLMFALVFALLLLGANVADAMERLEYERCIDPLTQIYNRRGFWEHVAEQQETLRCRRVSTVLMCDLDWFKRVNDQFGHAIGDRVLRSFGELLRGSVRKGDSVARFGGEEFAVLLHGADLAGAERVVQQIRDKLAATTYPDLPADFRITASFGLTELHSNENLEQAFHRADTLMYQAKQEGRDRVYAVA